jgi:hypothetical protein
MRKRRFAALAVLAVTVLSGPVVLRASPASAEAGNFWDTPLKTVTPDMIETGRITDGQDRVAQSEHYRIGMEGIGGRDPFEHCVEAEPRTAANNGGIVQINPCLQRPGVHPWWQWDWRFEPTDVIGLYRIRMGPKCLDVDNSFGIRNGDRVQLWDCLGPFQTNQYWWLVNIGLDDRLAMVSDAADRKCLIIDADRDFADYSPALIWDCMYLNRFGQLGQRFTPQNL